MRESLKSNKNDRKLTASEFYVSTFLTEVHTVDQRMVASVASKRNHIPRKSLNYQTPLEAFMSYMDVGRLSSLF